MEQEHLVSQEAHFMNVILSCNYLKTHMSLTK